MKFLVIDDSLTMRKIITLALKTGEYDFVEADSGEKALKILKNDKFDFFIVDINMPGINGIELIQEIRKKPEYLKTPIIILTTESEASLKQQGKDAGANAWLVKPFQKENLLELIKKL